MPAYHSSLSAPTSLGNMALLPINTKFKGPSPPGNGGPDVIDEALQYFKANVFFRTYEIKSEADRVLIYVTLYITECLKKLQKCSSKESGKKEMHSLAIANFAVPGEPLFPLNAMYQKPSSKAEADSMRSYLTQIRQETGQRIVERVFEPETNKPSKWWMCFVKRKFMDKSLSAPGQ
ncbi:actin-related protein 2/3 complex subunit 3-like [Acanthaster planci]|uniref:Actin-related protein 2/3 complex subunit 3 n=1 Tax=Acanthaster planci TaxID=133434 RepID=A0A8B7ZVS8_ACAPL|nr:actin-related protein 2/3 complex subunit 3-like [Acanthaster planci]